MKKIDITIHVEGIDAINIKIVSGATVGTLKLQKEGLSFSPPKAKKEPRGIIGWDKLPQIIALANGFAKVKS